MSEKITNIIEEIKAMPLLELADLVKAIEEEFGVSAAAVAVAAPAAGGDAGAAAAEKRRCAGKHGPDRPEGWVPFLYAQGHGRPQRIGQYPLRKEKMIFDGLPLAGRFFASKKGCRKAAFGFNGSRRT